MVWGIACDVLVPALVFYKTSPHAANTPGLPRASDLQGALAHLRNAIAHCAANVPLFGMYYLVSGVHLLTSCSRVLGSTLEKLNQVL